MKNSYNFKPLGKTLKEILIPSWPQAILFTSVSFIVLSVVFFDQIFKRLVDNDFLSQEYFRQTLLDYLDSLSYLPFSQYITTILFWGLIGCLAYFALITITNIIIVSRNDISLHQENRTPVVNDSLVLIDEYRRIIWIFVATVFISISFVKLFLIWINSFELGVNNFQALLLIYGVMFLAYNLYVGFMLVWVAVLNPSLLAKS